MKEISCIQMAYALLWREMGPISPRVREARGVLLAALTKAQQREAIAWVTEKYPVHEREVIDAAV